MSQTTLIIIVLLIAAALILLFWVMTRGRSGADDKAEIADSPVAATLAPPIPDDEGDASRPQTMSASAVPPGQPHLVNINALPVAPEVAVGVMADAPLDNHPADDLLLLKGIGPKLAVRLAELGVTRFDQIAAWTDADIDRIDAQLGAFKGRVRRDNWVDQAGYLARGDRAGFTAKYGAL